MAFQSNHESQRIFALHIGIHTDTILVYLLSLFIIWSFNSRFALKQDGFFSIRKEKAMAKPNQKQIFYNLYQDMWKLVKDLKTYDEMSDEDWECLLEESTRLCQKYEKVDTRTEDLVKESITSVISFIEREKQVKVARITDQGLEADYRWTKKERINFGEEIVFNFNPVEQEENSN